MGLRDSFENKAKKWALDKANELLGDKNAAPAPSPAPTTAGAAAPAPVSDEQAVADAQAQVGEKVVRGMFPKLGAWADQQKVELDKQQGAEAAKRRATVAARQVADVKIQLTGSVEGHWWGQLPLRFEVEPAKAQPDEFEAKDPFVSTQTLRVELTPQDDARPSIAGHAMASWLVSVPGYTGDASYDLVALNRRREAASFDVPYDDTVLDLGQDTDLQFYFYTDAGPSTVTVAGQHVTGSISMSGAVGTVVATLEITWPAAG